MLEKNIARLVRKTPHKAEGLVDLILGDWIGQGCHRIVYQHDTNENWVVKIQHSDKWSNIVEYEIWTLIMWTQYKKWFAECFYISRNGKALIQQKVEPITKDNMHLIPDKIPHFFADIKPSNFGFLNGQLVCHDYDYSLIKFVNSGLTSRMKSSKELKEIE